MMPVMRCPRCNEWCSTANQFLFRTREDEKNDRPGVMYNDCKYCGHQWPA